MKPYLLFLCIAMTSITALNCNKEGDCGCVPPPQQETSWKITSRMGSISGNLTQLTTDQQNNVLTLKPNGQFICTNTQTGMIVNGTVTTSNFNSIYGDRPRLVFNPQLPMLDNEYYILLGNTDGKLIFGDNIADGYSTTFSRRE
jgi:hypothetical protein